MKFNRRTIGLGLVLMLCFSAAQAHGPYRGGGYRHGGGWGYGGWWAPALVGGAMVGTAVYLSRPYPDVQPSTVIITHPPAVVVTTPQPAYGMQAGGMPAPAEAYYCQETRQYYPQVPTCVSPWLVVTPR
ncbi:hypothetical protein [Limnohabitans sp.]|uniref:hypothetical protein n=1 Tax=Limnohabitans sp. TaxID=1907725 RepID=UPI00286F1984|nr:hypothetical protein [Limnohabitans sp.]